MPAISYKYRVTYADGKSRTCSDTSSASCEVTDEEYLKIVQGAAEGYDIMEICGLEDVVSRMKNHLKKYPQLRPEKVAANLLNAAKFIVKDSEQK